MEFTQRSTQLQSGGATPSPAQTISRAQLLSYRIPLTQAFTIKQKPMTERHGLVLQIEYRDGSFGYGDVSPLPGFSKERLSDCLHDLAYVLRSAVSQPGQPLSARIEALPKAAAFALDCALAKIPCEQVSPPPVVPLLSGDAAQLIRRYQQLQQPALIKLKVARSSFNEEIDLIARLRALNPGLKLNLDANQSWTLSEAEQFVTAISTDVINYIEEPCNALEESLLFATKTGVKIALDETLQKENFQLNRNLMPENYSPVKALILKPTLLGSFHRCLAIIQQAKAAGIECHISSSFESSLGVAQLAYLAGQWLPGQAAGLDTLQSMSLDIICPSCNFSSDVNRLIDNQSNEAKPLIKPADLEPVWHS